MIPKLPSNPSHSLIQSLAQHSRSVQARDQADWTDDCLVISLMSQPLGQGPHGQSLLLSPSITWSFPL